MRLEGPLASRGACSQGSVRRVAFLIAAFPWREDALLCPPLATLGAFPTPYHVPGLQSSSLPTATALQVRIIRVLIITVLFPRWPKPDALCCDILAPSKKNHHPTGFCLFFPAWERRSFRASFVKSRTPPRTGFPACNPLRLQCGADLLRQPLAGVKKEGLSNDSSARAVCPGTALRLSSEQLPKNLPKAYI